MPPKRIPKSRLECYTKKTDGKSKIICFDSGEKTKPKSEDVKIMKTLEIIRDLEKLVQKKGRHHWYKSTGKLIINGNNGNDTKTNFVKIIKKQKKKFLDKFVINVRVIFHKDPEKIMNPERGGIEMQAMVFHITEVNGKLVLHVRDDTHSVIRMFYPQPHIKKFKIKHMKQLAKAALSGKYESDLFKFYTYSDFKNVLT